MSTPDLDGPVRTAVARHLDVAPESLTAHSDLEALGVTEDTAGSLLEAVENALDVRFPDDFLEGVHTYGDLAVAVRVAVAY